MYSFFSRVIDWLDERTGLKKPVIDALRHPVPPNAKWSYVFGTAILASFVVQLVSGVALATLYVPSAEGAFQSVEYITSQAIFGNLVRGMHFFGASSMIAFAIIHMIRVYLTASYKYPRELNWLTGVALLFFTLAMGFTGQVLRWDQNSIWTIAVGAEQAQRAPFVGNLLSQMILSGNTIGSSTLSHFFVLHVFVFPGILIAGIGLHVYLVLKNGISEPPVAGEPTEPETYKAKYRELLQKTGRPFWPDAVWRDVVFSTIVVAGILALSFWVGPPPSENLPDPSVTDARPRPDWYLVWYFALLALLPHKAEDPIIILMPLSLAAALLVVPFFNRGERALKRRPWALGIVICALTALAALTVAGYKEDWTPDFKAQPLLPDKNSKMSEQAIAGAQVFNDKGCLFCHTFTGHGGERGPDLTDVADRLSHDQIVVKIVNGGYNMPGYAGNLTPKQLADVTAFLESKRTVFEISASISAEEKKRIHDIAQDGIAEIKLGQLARSKGLSPDVKAFGEKMVEEHTIADEELRQAARAMNLTLPDYMNQDQQALYHDLSQLSGAEFDRRYMNEMVKAHSKALDAIRKEAEEGTADLGIWAKQAVFTIKRHHHMAKEKVDAGTLP